MPGSNGCCPGWACRSAREVTWLHRSRRHPRVETLLRRRDRGLLAVPRQHPGLRGERKQRRPDRRQLPGEVGVVALVRAWPGGDQRVPGEHHTQILAVDADRTGGVPWGVQYLQGHVGYLE